jgi:hypothetical protein
MASQMSSQISSSPMSSHSFAPSLTVSRRAPIDLSLPLAASSNGGAASADQRIELDSPLDVPAFLRRQS